MHIICRDMRTILFTFRMCASYVVLCTVINIFCNKMKIFQTHRRVPKSNWKIVKQQRQNRYLLTHVYYARQLTLLAWNRHVHSHRYLLTHVYYTRQLTLLAWNRHVHTNRYLLIHVYYTRQLTPMAWNRHVHTNRCVFLWAHISLLSEIMRLFLKVTNEWRR